MNVLVLGAAGFIGTNLAIKLAENKENNITLVDKKMTYFSGIEKFHFMNVEIKESSLNEDMDFSILEGQDVIYHLVSTNVPTNSNQHITQDIQTNVIFSSNLFEACVKYGVKKVVFISSGGTVYGKEVACPLSENTPTNPISSYGVQKITIEKLLYLYNYMYGLDYRIIRLANPYGPYQRPNGVLGAVTTFTYKALTGDEVQVYGDGSVAIVTSGYFPVPPVKGGAIEALVNLIIGENNKNADVDLTVYSMYDVEAEKISKGYASTEVKYVYIPWLIKRIDCLIYFICKNILKKKKHMSYRYIAQRLYFINAVSRMISCEDYDALVFQNHPTLLNTLKKHGNRKRYCGKYYYHAHNEINNDFGNAILLKECKKIICVSHFIEESIAKSLSMSDESKFVVLRNRVDETKFGRVDNTKESWFKNKYSIPDGYTLFTFTGRLNPEKGVKELLMAYKQARPLNSKLVIAGSYFFGSNMKSDYEVELERIAADIKEQIIFTGNIDYSDMPILYHVSDVIVLPSIWNDPAPLTIIESLTCGKPLITTFSGGIPEYANERNSLIYQVNDNLIDNLAKGIKYLSENLEARKRLSENATQESANWTKASYYSDFIDCVS